jgi:phage tail sheath protein FI
MFFLSPGVYTREIDLSEIVPSVATSIAAVVGAPKKGDVTKAVLITTQQQLFDEYGYPTPGNYFHYSAIGYLAQGQQLYCVRAHNAALYGGLKIVTAGSGSPNAAFSSGIADRDTVVFAGDELLAIMGKNPGVWDNGIKIKLINVNVVDHTFDIIVTYPNSSGVDVEVERFEGCSRKSQLDGFGVQRYVEDRVNLYSAYIYVKDNATVADTTDPKLQSTALAIAQGSDGSAVTDSQINAGWDKFANPDEININILVNAGYTSTAVQNKLITIAESRKDCIAILDMPYASNTPATMITYRSTTLNANSSYAALYTHWIKIYDQWNDKTIPVPASGFIAGTYALTDYVRDPWFSPAGFSRGRLVVSDVTYKFSQGERDTLYPVQINPIQSFKGEGIVVWGDKTLQSKSSALSYIPIRRLLIVLEKSISRALRVFNFEPNDPITRLRIKQMCDEFLEIVKRRRGLEDYRTVCDDSNNPPAVRERGELHVDVYVKPVFPAEYIQLSVIITRLGASFDELIAKGF